MVERRRFGNLLPHLILITGVIIVIFPVYIAFVASTSDPASISNGQMGFRPGGHFAENYYQTIFVGTNYSTREPIGNLT